MENEIAAVKKEVLDIIDAANAGYRYFLFFIFHSTAPPKKMPNHRTYLNFSLCFYTNMLDQF